MVTESIDYRKFSNRVCNKKEAIFISIGFAIAVAVVATILLSIFFATKCATGESPCKSSGTTCVPDGQFCDGSKNCPIGEDEWECFPNEFYVSFRTNMGYGSELDNNASTLYNETMKHLTAQISTPIAVAYGNLSTVEVFRLRGVTDEGLADGMWLAVDSIVKIIPAGKKVTTAEKDLENFPIYPENLTLVVVNGLKQLDAQIDERTNKNVTTGVAVVLRAPEGSSCRVPTVYCVNFCKPKHVYQYGTTKGCPECICSEKPISEPVPS